eukprot:SM000004S14926  [mRNA]  locus=s4:245641:256720:- [translate_table: standard]
MSGVRTRSPPHTLVGSLVAVSPLLRLTNSGAAHVKCDILMVEMQPCRPSRSSRQELREAALQHYDASPATREAAELEVAGPERAALVLRPTFLLARDGLARGLWPALSASLSKRVAISGLLRKALLAGHPPQRPRVVFLATAATAVALLERPEAALEEPRRRPNDAAAKSEHSASVTGREFCEHASSGTVSYVGTVTGVVLDGAQLELDGCARLLLTHTPSWPLGGICLGSLVLLRHVHVHKVRGTQQERLVFGACIYSHISVVGTAPMYESLIKVHPLPACSLLRAHLDRLPFILAFKLMEVLQAFHVKFPGYFSNQQLLGNCAKDVIDEFLEHSLHCQLGSPIEQRSSIQTQVLTVAELLQAAALLSRTALEAHVSKGQRRVEHGNLESQVVTRKTGKELGVVLLATLQVSPRTGSLELADATGALGVVIDGRLQRSQLKSIYKVTDFDLIVHSRPSVVPLRECNVGQSDLPWAQAFQHCTTAGMQPWDPSQAECFIVFCLQDAAFVRSLHSSVSHTQFTGSSWALALRRGDLRVIMIIQKNCFAKHKARRSSSAASCQNSMGFQAKAVLLPYRILDNNSVEPLSGPSSPCRVVFHKSQQCRHTQAQSKGAAGSVQDIKCYIQLGGVKQRQAALEGHLQHILLSFSLTSLENHSTLHVGRCYLTSWPEPKPLGAHEAFLKAMKKAQGGQLEPEHCASPVTLRDPHLWSVSFAAQPEEDKIADKLDACCQNRASFQDQRREECASSLCAAKDDVEIVLIATAARLHEELVQSLAEWHTRPILQIHQLLRDESGEACREPTMLPKPSTPATKLVMTECRSSHCQQTWGADQRTVSFDGIVAAITISLDQPLTEVLEVRDPDQSTLFPVYVDFYTHCRPVGLGPGMRVRFSHFQLGRMYDGTLYATQIGSSLITVISAADRTLQQSKTCQDATNSNIDLPIRALLLQELVHESPSDSEVGLYRICCRVVAVRHVVFGFMCESCCARDRRTWKRGGCKSCCTSDDLKMQLVIEELEVAVEDHTGQALCRAAGLPAGELLGLPERAPRRRPRESAQQFGIATREEYMTELLALLRRHGRVVAQREGPALPAGGELGAVMPTAVSSSLQQALGGRDREVVEELFLRASVQKPKVLVCQQNWQSQQKKPRAQSHSTGTIGASQTLGCTAALSHCQLSLVATKASRTEASARLLCQELEAAMSADPIFPAVVKLQPRMTHIISLVAGRMDNVSTTKGPELRRRETSPASATRPGDADLDLTLPPSEGGVRT